MKEWIRRGVVFAAKKLMTGKTSNTVYDYSNSKYYNFNGSGTSIYDYDLGCYINIAGSSPKYTLYHYKNSKNITFEIKSDKKFEGYDYDSRCNYSGRISASSISLYDYETGQYYNYSI